MPEVVDAHVQLEALRGLAWRTGQGQPGIVDQDVQRPVGGDLLRRRPNGVEVGIRVSGLGDRWFVGPAALPDPAKLFDGYTPADMQRDLGDSAIVETYGLGALAVAASPLSVPSVVDASGVRRVIEVPLADEERERLHASAGAIRASLGALGID